MILYLSEFEKKELPRLPRANLLSVRPKIQLICSKCYEDEERLSCYCASKNGSQNTKNLKGQHCCEKGKIN